MKGDKSGSNGCGPASQVSERGSTSQRDVFVSARLQHHDGPRKKQERIARGAERCHGESGERTVDNGRGGGGAKMSVKSLGWGDGRAELGLDACMPSENPCNTCTRNMVDGRNFLRRRSRIPPIRVKQ
jgi:hypothetical protein